MIRSSGGEEENNRRWHIGSQPKKATRWSLAALAVSGLAVIGSWATLQGVHTALLTLSQAGIFADGLLLLLGIAVAFLLLPPIRSLKLAGEAKRLLSGGDLIGARVAAAASRNLSWITFGYAGAQILIVLLVQFFIVNDLAVSRIFFLLPLIRDSFPVVLGAFWINVYIFVVAEVLVLIWGLIIALAHLAPGTAGKPIRMLAIIYTDVFRALPAIITIYLVGFGLPLTGLPVLKSFSPISFAILALTLTSSAYVAEVYRAGIESIHWSQTAAARSLALSYIQTLRFVIVPQAVRRMIPPLLNQFISLQKDTALVGVIGVVDAFSQAQTIAIARFNLSAVTTVAIFFVVITIPQARLVDKFTQRGQRRMRAGGS